MDVTTRCTLFDNYNFLKYLILGIITRGTLFDNYTFEKYVPMGVTTRCTLLDARTKHKRNRLNSSVNIKLK